MLYALLGDLHSNIEDTKAVLTHIQQTAKEAKIIGLGDLYECTISKKKPKRCLGYLYKEQRSLKINLRNC